MTNLLQCATFPEITHKFLDYLFASSKKKMLYFHVLTRLCFLYIYINIYIYIYIITPISFLHKKKKKKLLPSSTPYLLPTNIPITTHLFSFPSPHLNIHNILLIYCSDFPYQG